MYSYDELALEETVGLSWDRLHDDDDDDGDDDRVCVMKKKMHTWFTVVIILCIYLFITHIVKDAGYKVSK